MRYLAAPFGVYSILTLSLTVSGLTSCTQEQPAQRQSSTTAQTQNVPTSLRSTGLTPSTTTSDPAAALFQKRCSRCHGVNGDGRGTFANQLNPPPTDLTSPVWFKQTDEQKIKRVILGGGRAIGKSPMMPSHSDLRNKPQLLKALVRYIVDLAPRAPQNIQPVE